MPGAEGNDHVRLMDSQGNTQRTDSVLSPEAIEDADRVGADELSGLGLALGSADTVTSIETANRTVPSLSASSSADFSSVTVTPETFDFNAVFDSDPRVFIQWIQPHPGVTAYVFGTSPSGFTMEFRNASASSFGIGALAFEYIAVTTA